MTEGVQTEEPQGGGGGGCGGAGGGGCEGMGEGSSHTAAAG